MKIKCYQVKLAKGEHKHYKVAQVCVNNPLRADQIDTLKEEERCVPSTVVAPEP